MANGQKSYFIHVIITICGFIIETIKNKSKDMLMNQDENPLAAYISGQREPSVCSRKKSKSKENYTYNKKQKNKYNKKRKVNTRTEEWRPWYDILTPAKNKNKRIVE